jgi:putative FmdB family regulatory protein
MPIYSYKCYNCKRETDILEKYEGKGPRECAHCGSAIGMKRQLSAPASRVKDGVYDEFL